MKKFFCLVIAFCILICICACNKNDNLNKSSNNTESTSVDENYLKVIELIDQKNFEEAYKKIDNIKDPKNAESIRNKFIIIKDVLLTQTLNIPNDKFGNKVGPYTINYMYDDNGNLIETDANDISVLNALDTPNAFNPFMRNIYCANYTPYHEELVYDSSHKLVSIIGYDKNSQNITYTANFFYDKNNKLSKVDFIYGYGTVTTYFNYDENGVIKSIEPEPKTSYFVSKVFNYDEFGNIIEEGTSYDSIGRVKESKFHYHKSGQLLEGRCIWNYGDFYIYKG